MKSPQRNLMESASEMWEEAERLNDPVTNPRPDLVESMLATRLAMNQSLRTEALTVAKPPHPLPRAHD